MAETKRRKPTALTPMSVRHLEADGWLVDKVEQRVTSIVTRDLFGFIDLIAIRGSETLAVQVTSTANQANRIDKIAQSPYVAAVREAGWAIHVHGWKHSKRSGEWEVTITDVS